MPAYDYRCKDCRQTFTVERSMSESGDDSACEHCGSKEVTRIWNAFIRAGGITPDVGQGAPKKSSGGGGCGSCSSHSCGTCH